MKRIIGWGILVGGLAWLGWVIVARVQEVQEARANPEAVVIPPSAVRVTPVREAAIGSEVRAAGEVRARAVVSVFPKIGGRALEVHAEVGQRVDAGQPLVTQDEGDLAWRVKQAEAGLRAGNAGVRQATAQLELAETELERAEKLFAENAVSSADVERARGAVSLAEAAVAGANGQVALAEAGLGLAEEAAGWAVVESPVAGVVSKRYASVGQMLGPQGPVFELVDDGRLDVVVDLEPAVAAAVAAGARAEASVEAAGRGRWPLVLRHVAPAVDPMTRRVRAEFELEGAGADAIQSEDEAGATRGKVLANMTAEIFVALGGGEDKRLVAPLGAVVRLPEGRSVFVVRNGKAHRVAVSEAETVVGGDVVVLKVGDAADAAKVGDKVVIDGQGDLSEGAAVQVTEEVAPPPEAEEAADTAAPAAETEEAPEGENAGDAPAEAADGADDAEKTENTEKAEKAEKANEAPAEKSDAPESDEPAKDDARKVDTSEGDAAADAGDDKPAGKKSRKRTGKKDDAPSAEADEAPAEDGAGKPASKADEGARP
jgi:RND family efflux transporter MFP subunit